MIALALAATLLTSPGEHDWTTRDTIIQGTVVALTVADLALTQSGLGHDDIRERNPILGTRPSPAKLWTLGLGGLALHTAVAYALPRPYREAWQSLAISVQSIVVIGNTIVLVGRW